MLSFSLRQRQGWPRALALALLAAVALLLLRSLLEHAVRTRVVAMAARQGMVARIGRVRVGAWPLLRLEDFNLEAARPPRFHADAVSATWAGHLRLAIRAASVSGPAGLSMSLPDTSWDASGLLGGNLHLALAKPRRGLAIDSRAYPAGKTWTIVASALDLGQLLELRRDGQLLFDGGIATGSARLQDNAGALRFDLDMAIRATHLGSLAGQDTDGPQLGDPIDVALQSSGTWLRAAGTIDVPHLRATVAGATVAGTLALRDLGTDPAIDLALGVQQLDFAQLLRASGLALPASLAIAAGHEDDLGSATIDLGVRGRLSDPAALATSQKVSFRPPRQVPPAIARLRGDFTFGADEGAGPHAAIDVSPASPDFIALHDVPPLFVRTLLLAEDAGFYGHRGIDLRELPTALVTNWTRGGAARGASTLTQQLAKNLFLSREKQLGRKLQELAITLQLESALSKDRILEIYLNIIEWGPGLRGLRPAARAYFGCEPRALSPAQVAFLVAMIPGPIKYQVSFAHGTPGPGLRALVDALLAKMRSVDAISEEDYRRALAEPLAIGSRPRAG